MAGITVDRPSFEKIEKLLHGLNNHAVVICGFIEEDIDERTLEILKNHASDFRKILAEVSKVFGRLHKDYVNSIQDGEITDRISDEG